MYFLEAMDSTEDNPLFIALNIKQVSAGAHDRGFRVFRWTKTKDEALRFAELKDAQEYIKANEQSNLHCKIVLRKDFPLGKDDLSGE